MFLSTVASPTTLQTALVVSQERLWSVELVGWLVG